MYFLLVRHKLLTHSSLFCSRFLGWIYFCLLGKNGLINHLISSPFDSIMWAPGSVPKPAEVNEKIPLDLPDPWITNWMRGCTVCLAQPKCRVFLQGMGLYMYPPAPQFVLLILCLCGTSDQPYNSAKIWFGKKKTQAKQTKNTLKSKWLQEPRQRCNYFCVSSSMFGISRVNGFI